MDAPRHRFRREDIEGEASTEGLSEFDVKLASIEGELRTVSLSSAMAARDSQALRARVDELERGSGGHIESTLSKVYDHIESQDDRIEQVFDHLKVLERRVQDVIVRLDSLGEVGRIENLPNVLAQTLETSLDELESRIEGRLAGLGSQDKGASSEELTGIRQEIDSKNRELRLQIEKVLDKRRDDTVELIENAVRHLHVEELRQSLTGELDLVRSALVELQEVTEDLPSREDYQRLEVSSQGAAGSVADSEELAALRSQVQAALSEFSNTKEQLASVRGLFDGENWAAKLGAQLEDMKQSAGIIEKHQERVDLALRLVTQLEEKARGLSFAGGGVSGTGAADSDLAPPPGEPQLKLTLKDLIREMVKNRVSDLHIKTGRAITARIGRELIQFSTPPLTPADSYQLIISALRPSHRKRLFQERDIEFVYQYESVRLRANVFYDRGNISATFRMLSGRPPELESLGLPKAFASILGRGSGLVLVCGLPGSGRSTTLTAGIDYLNRTRQMHLVSLEDRLDFAHEDRRSLVTQRELGDDIVSYAHGIRSAMGQDADAVFVADLVDRQTMEEAFAAVESGCLVVGAVKAQSVEDGIARLINVFAEGDRRVKARAFAHNLQGILALKLFDRADGEGQQVPASELLIANSTVKKLIEEANLSALRSQIAKGSAEGMQTFSQSIERLKDTGLIRAEDAQRALERLGGDAAKSGASLGGDGLKGMSHGAPVARSGGSSAPSPTSAPGNPTGAREPSASHSVESGTKPPESFGEEDTLMNWL